MIKVFIDTSAFKGLLDANDDFHQQAVKRFAKFRSEQVMLYTSNYIIDETATLIRCKASYELSLFFKEFISEHKREIKTPRVTLEDEQAAWVWFKENWSKLSYTDCVSFAQLKRLEITNVFTYDQHFARAGFVVQS